MPNIKKKCLQKYAWPIDAYNPTYVSKMSLVYLQAQPVAKEFSHSLSVCMDALKNHYETC